MFQAKELQARRLQSRKKTRAQDCQYADQFCGGVPGGNRYSEKGFERAESTCGFQNPFLDILFSLSRMKYNNYGINEV
jgi:hypothetical protein